MAKRKLIPTKTSINLSGSIIDIFNEYILSVELPYTIQSSIQGTTGLREGVPFIEGELLIKMFDDKFPSEIDYFLQEDGTLTVKSESGDVNSYYIDEEGYLIYDDSLWKIEI